MPFGHYKVIFPRLQVPCLFSLPAFSPKKRKPAPERRRFQAVDKVRGTLSTDKMQPGARTRCPLQADLSYTSGPRSVFDHVHAAVENGFDFLRACGRELCEALSTVCPRAGKFPARGLFCLPCVRGGGQRGRRGRQVAAFAPLTRCSAGPTELPGPGSSRDSSGPGSAGNPRHPLP